MTGFEHLELISTRPVEILHGSKESGVGEFIDREYNDGMWIQTCAWHGRSWVFYGENELLRSSEDLSWIWSEAVALFAADQEDWGNHYFYSDSAAIHG